MSRFLKQWKALSSLALAIAFAPAAGAGPLDTPSLRGGAAFRDCPDCVEMAVIPPGSFNMGSSLDERAREGVPEAFASREGPQHRVTIPRAFALARYEITRAQYARFVSATHRPDPPGCGVHDAKADSWAEKPGYSWRKPSFDQTDQHPAACISWQDATDYAAWLAKTTGKPYRLASEAEWEYAARGGTTTARYWGDAAELACQQANIMTSATVEKLGTPRSWTKQLVCMDDSHAFTEPVGSYAPNPFGLYDMIGNVFEWVQDCYHPNYVGAPTDGSAWNEPDCKLRVPKGGGFHSAPWIARPAFHGGPVKPDAHPVASGIRVARDLF